MTDSDAKEWVTIKVPKAVRDDAQADSRTYGEILRAGLESATTEVAGEMVTVASPDKSISAEDVDDALADVGVDLPDDLRNQLDRIEAAATTAEERTGSIQHTLEELKR